MAQGAHTEERVLAIVGGGPMATYALERLAALIPSYPSIGPLRIVVFERTGRFGAGDVHSDDQPQTNLLNRVVGEIAFGADETHRSVSTLLPWDLRFTFSAWCQSTARIHDGTLLSDRDYAPRRVHGLALRDVFERYCDRLRLNGVALDLYDAEVIDVAEAGPARFLVMSASHKAPPVEADHILFVTGHSINVVGPGDPPFLLNSPHDDCYVRSVYPIDRNVTFDKAPPGSRIGLLGFGLSAIDVMLHLTEGRGGSFVETGGPTTADGLRYQRSGLEPSTIAIVTSTGLPLLARAENFKVGQEAGGRHQGVYLTHDTLSLLRERHGHPTRFCSGLHQRQLDFDRHVLPVIALEMAYVYFTVLLGAQWKETLQGRVRPAFDQFLHDPNADPWVSIASLIEPLEKTAGSGLPTIGGRSRYPVLVDWRALLDPGATIDTTGEGTFCARVEAQMVADIAAALEGNVSNPLKAALDGVWRDLRGVIAAAADRGGLTARSHRRFVRIHARTHNRLCNGPSAQAMRKVLALIRAGVVDVSVGPMPRIERRAAQGGFVVTGGLTDVVRALDVLMEARVHPFHAARDHRPLYPNLLRRGLVRMWTNPADPPEASYTPGALDVDKAFHPVRADGCVEKRMAFLGAPIDGLVHLQLSLARPGGNSSIPNLLNGWAEETLRMLMPKLGLPSAEHVETQTVANGLAQPAH